MAEIEPLLRIRDLDPGIVRAAVNGQVTPQHVLFDADNDALTIMFVPMDTPTVVHFIDNDDFALLFEPESRNVVGFYIESFLRSFVERHADQPSVQALAELARRFSEYGGLVAIHEEPRPGVRENVRLLARQLQRDIPPGTGPLGQIVPA